MASLKTHYGNYRIVFRFGGQKYSRSLKTKPRSLSRCRKWFGPFEIVVACEFAVLLLAAAAHRLQIDDPDGCRTSPLIAVEVMGILASLPVVPIALGRSIYLGMNGRMAGAVLNLLICLVTPGVWWAAFSIDAPTLVYATKALHALSAADPADRPSRRAAIPSRYLVGWAKNR